MKTKEEETIEGNSINDFFMFAIYYLIKKNRWKQFNMQKHWIITCLTLWTKKIFGWVTKNILIARTRNLRIFYHVRSLAFTHCESFLAVKRCEFTCACHKWFVYENKLKNYISLGQALSQFCATHFLVSRVLGKDLCFCLEKEPCYGLQSSTWLGKIQDLALLQFPNWTLSFLLNRRIAHPWSSRIHCKICP